MTMPFKRIDRRLVSLTAPSSFEAEQYQALRLKLGEDYQGWKLRAIQGRQVTMEKDQQTAVLTLPLPGGESSGEVQLIPVSINEQPPRSARNR